MNADVLVGQEIGQDTGHHHIQARRITDDGHDFVSHCDDELSQSSPDDFSLPHGFLLHAQSECMSLPFVDTDLSSVQVGRIRLESKLRTRVYRRLENTWYLTKSGFYDLARERSLRRIHA